MAGIAFVIVAKVIIIKDNNKRLLVIILVETIFKVLLVTHSLNLNVITYRKRAFRQIRQLLWFLLNNFVTYVNILSLPVVLFLAYNSVSTSHS